MDLSTDMLAQIEDSLVDFKCCADMDALPFASNSFDAIFSNFSSQWSVDFAALIDQLNMILKPGGRLYLTNVLDGSLAEIAQAWQAIDNEKHINNFISFDTFEASAKLSAFKSHRVYFTGDVDLLAKDAAPRIQETSQNPG